MDWHIYFVVGVQKRLVCAAPQHGVHVTESASDLVSSCVQRAQEATRSGTLLRLPFETLFEYLKVFCPNLLPVVFIRTSEHCKRFILPCMENAHPGMLRSSEHCAILKLPSMQAGSRTGAHEQERKLPSFWSDLLVHHADLANHC